MYKETDSIKGARMYPHSPLSDEFHAAVARKLALAVKACGYKPSDIRHTAIGTVECTVAHTDVRGDLTVIVQIPVASVAALDTATLESRLMKMIERAVKNAPAQNSQETNL